MSLKSQIATLSATVVMLGTLNSHVRAQEPAAIMPLASKSVLLDITIAEDRLVAAGEHGHILLSDDNGSNWHQGSVPTTQMLTAIYFIDALHGWVVGHDGLILASDDGGKSWRLQRDGLAVQQEKNVAKRTKAQAQVRQFTQQLEIADEETRVQLEPDLEDAKMELEEAELTLSEALFTSPLMDVWFENKATGWAVGAFGTFLNTGDGGQHWQSQEALLDNPDGFHINTIAGDGRGRIFLAGEGGAMFRSLDSGQTWETLESFYDGSWFGAVYSAQHDTLLVFGLRGNLYRSTDFGTNWDKIDTGNHITLAGGNASTAGDIVLVGGEGTVLLSSDGGQSFQQTTTEDRLSLSSGISQTDRAILVGQGGIKIIEGAAAHE
jgi:photosystem II stability/assembly factor-like uncharacterized protein